MVRRNWRDDINKILHSTLGITISRQVHSKHFYPALAKIRRWSEKDVIFDVGANDGRTVLTLQELLPRPRIFAFEPVSATFETLKRQTARFHNVQAFPYALGDVPGRADMQLHELSVMNSLLTPPTESIGSESVELRTVDGMMQELGVEFLHFLKIDTEGYELNVLKGAAEALGSARIGIIQAEFHVTEQEGLQRIEDHLAPYGYELYTIANQTHNSVASGKDWPYADAAGYVPKRLNYADAVYLYTGRVVTSSRPVLM